MNTNERLLKTVFIIQASTVDWRGDVDHSIKVLNGKPMIEHVINNIITWYGEAVDIIIAALDNF